MKRSDMLDIFEIVLNGAIREYIEKYNTKLLADELLSGIERKGMLPPQRKPIEFDKLGLGNPWSWEKEDE